MSPETSSIAVVYFPDGWRIVAGDHSWGRYDYRIDAEEAALRLAAKARQKRHAVEVFAQQRHGELRRLVA